MLDIAGLDRDFVSYGYARRKLFLIMVKLELVLWVEGFKGAMMSYAQLALNEF